jgi:GNAT superfamily N-acetyltransferase
MPTAAAAAASTTVLPAAHTGRITIRRLLPTDSLGDLTALLHRAYAGQMAMGLRPLAGRQDVATTARRCASGECYIAVLRDALRKADLPGSNGHLNGTLPPPEQLVGTILFHEVEDAKGPPWFARQDVDSFSQFAVDPGYQGHGVGRLLLETVERRAAECGARELGLSMAEPDRALMEFYLRRGYRFIEPWVWPYTNYRSAILSKALGG